MNTELIPFDETDANNKEIIADINIKPEDLDNIFSMSVNWTFEGLCTLIDNGSINLSPSFQRGNVWDDNRKSNLIESIYLNLPIPPIILAEYSGEDNKKKYVVIDGKQRLSTMTGFFNPEKYPYCKNKGQVEKLQIAAKLDGLSYKDLDNNTKRRLNNSIVPTWTMHNISEDKKDILYHIFYRMNTAGMPLNLQELRQALYMGGFSDYLSDITKELQPFQEVMGYNKPDERMNDVEYLLRIFANKFLLDQYKGNLAGFLDNAMKYLNKNWNKLEKEIKECYQKINLAIENLEKIYNNKKSIATINVENKRFNKALFEVQLYYFADIDRQKLNEQSIASFKLNMENALKDRKFSDLFTQGTNTNYKKRFEEFEKIVNSSFK